MYDIIANNSRQHRCNCELYRPRDTNRQTDRREAVKGPAQWINSQFGGRQVSTDAEY